MNQATPVAPATPVARHASGDPPGGPPGDFGPVLAQAAEAPPPKSRDDGARTATAEGAEPEAAETAAEEGDSPETEVSATPAKAAGAPGTAAPAVASTIASIETAPTAPAETAPPATPIRAAVPADAEVASPVAAAAASPSIPVAATTPAAVSAPIDLQPAADTGTPDAKGALQPAMQPAVTEPLGQDASASGREGAHGRKDGAAPFPRQQSAATVATAAPLADAEPQSAKAAPTASAPAAKPEAAGAGTTPAAPATPTAQPVAAAQPQQPVVVERPPSAEPPARAHTHLAGLADTARTVVRIAARDGAAQAHITLHPAELGEVEIRLRYHAGGVSADVVAESHAAAQVLQQASAELRRSLEAQGLVVHDLDVRQGEQEGRRAHEHDRRAGRSPGDAPDLDHLEPTPIDPSSLPLAAGAVDVLA